MSTRGPTEYKLGVMVYRCLHDRAPRYLAVLIPASDAAPRRLRLYDPLTWIVSLFLAADLARTAVWHFITLARQSGTRCQMNFEILTVLIALNDFWKQFFSAVTSVTSAFSSEMRYKSTCYLLTYFTIPHRWSSIFRNEEEPKQHNATH